MNNQKQTKQSVILDGLDDFTQHQKTALPFLGIVFFITLFISTAIIAWIVAPHSLIDYGQIFLWAVLFSNVTLFMVAFIYHQLDKESN